MECMNCGNAIKQTGQYFCSADCYHKYRSGKPLRNRIASERYCEVCGKPLLSYKLKKYCSRECYHKSPTKGKPFKKPRKLCLICGQSIEGRGIKFCSVVCSSKDKIGKERPEMWKRAIKYCKQCGKEFMVGGRLRRSSNSQFCSNKCVHESQKKDTGYRAWYRLSKEVRERDGKCMLCGNTQRRLQPHHIVPRDYKKWSEFNGVEKLEDLVCFCAGCHQGIEALTKAGYRNNPDFDPHELINMVRIKD